MDDFTKKIIDGFEKTGYILNEEMAAVIYLAQDLEKPLLLEGEPGVGKTTVATTLAEYLQLRLVRLQCYEGLDVNTAIYEWNYQKQLLFIKMSEAQGQVSELSTQIFGDEFLLKRPLLESITQPQKIVLLIDEIDRADEEFEAFLLEMLSDFQISIPEIGTIKANYKPCVILTSNRTRELSDALKRRCLYHWLDFPATEKEVKIICQRVPGISEDLVGQLVMILCKLRESNLNKQPGIAEGIDWARTLLSLQCKKLSEKIIEQTAGVILKNREDIYQLKGMIQKLI